WEHTPSSSPSTESTTCCALARAARRRRKWKQTSKLVWPGRRACQARTCQGRRAPAMPCCVARAPTSMPARRSTSRLRLARRTRRW
ncbi:unnamed protein product, partial [Ectocarpus fasciculatus]